jgi:hypothetical protein
MTSPEIQKFKMNGSLFFFVAHPTMGEQDWSADRAAEMPTELTSPNVNVLLPDTRPSS